MSGKTVTRWIVGLLALFACVGDAPAQTRTRTRVPAKAKPAPKDKTVADTITLKDGKTLLGQVVSERGSTLVVVRRAWASKNLPEWFAKWEKAEQTANAGAATVRKERLQAWRRDRGNGAASPNDMITGWLDRSLAKPAEDPSATPLMVVKLVRPEVKLVQKRGPQANRMMRQAWTIGLDDAETLPIDEVKAAIEGRGLDPENGSPVSLDPLVPLQAEPDVQWALRRAATELLYDQDVRFIRYGSVILPEPNPGEPPKIADAGAILSSALKDILGEAPADPLPPILNGVSGKGRTGALITRLDMSPDFASVTIEASVYLFNGRNWSRGPSRAATFATNDVPAGDVNAIAEDPQVKSAFSFIESSGIFQVNESMKRQSLAVGATTQRALRTARSTLNRDLADVALSLEDAPAKRQAP